MRRDFCIESRNEKHKENRNKAKEGRNVEEGLKRYRFMRADEWKEKISAQQEIRKYIRKKQKNKDNAK
jgi:hypothetical protein